MFISSLRYSIYKVQPLAVANFNIVAEVIPFVKRFFLFFRNFFCSLSSRLRRSSDSLRILAQGFGFVKHEFIFFEKNLSGPDIRGNLAQRLGGIGICTG